MHRKLSPIQELDGIAPADRDKLFDDLQHGLSYDRAVRRIGAEHFIAIKRHHLVTWWHRERQRRDINALLPAEFQLHADQLLDLLNAEDVPWSNLSAYYLQRAAATIAARQDSTPSQLLTLLRVVDSPFRIQTTRRKQDLEDRKLDLRQRIFDFQQLKAGSTLSTTTAPPQTIVDGRALFQQTPVAAATFVIEGFPSPAVQPERVLA